jgi:hypothetical protein
VKFYLGTHEPHWLGRLDVPMFVSRRRLMRLKKKLPQARAEWALDSGGFSELSMYGEWRTEPTAYIDAARRYMSIGHMAWAAPMDWMCEPFMLERTGQTVDRHQGRTVENVSLLREDAPDVPWIPVLQGWDINDYLACISRYSAAGIDLCAEPVVGVGSVCRRQATEEIGAIFNALIDAGVRCHGFGVKAGGFSLYAGMLTSADSMSWSYQARRNAPHPDCTHASCQNCWRYALAWRARLLSRLEPEEIAS